MNFNKETGLMAAGLIAATAGSLDAHGADLPSQDENIISVEQQSEVAREVSEAPDTFVFGDTKGNEAKENIANIEFAKEALSHVGKGAYLSKLRPGVVLISTINNQSHNGSLSYEHSISVTSYPTSDTPVIGQYKAYGMAYDSETPSADQAFKFSERDISDKALDASLTLSVLMSEGMTATDAYGLISHANPELTVKSLSDCMLSNELVTSNENDRREAMRIIKMLESMPPSQQHMADTQNLASIIK